RAYVDAFHLIAEPRKVFTQPTRSTTNIQNAAAGRQTKDGGDVGKVTKMTMRFRIHAIALMLVRFVREIVKRLRFKVVAALRVESTWIFDGSPLVVNAF